MFFRKLTFAGLIGVMVLAVTAAYAPASSPQPAQQDIPPAQGKVLKIAADLWCPINCTPISDEEGIGIDLARKIFEPLGYTIDYMLVPWARALEDVRAGKVDAVIGATPADDPNLVFPQSGIVEINDDFYVLEEDTWKYENAESLEGRRLGVITDYGYTDVIIAFTQKHEREAGMVQKVGGGDALEQNLRKLLAGRVNVVVESAPVMQYMLKRLGLQEKVKWAGSIKQGPVHLAFSPAREGSAELARQWEEGIARLRTAGELPAMYERYGLKPLE